MTERKNRTRKQRMPEGPPPPPVVQRLWIRYSKTGRLRFMSHRDYTRVFERAIRRAQLPIAFSAGFTPHPKISWVGAAPTGVASLAEYVEIGLAVGLDPATVHERLAQSLPADLGVHEVIEALGKSLAERVNASVWELGFPGLDPDSAARAVRELLAAEEVVVQRITQSGRKAVDVRGALVSLDSRAADQDCAIMTAVVRQSIPVVRPDDLFAALREVAGLEPPQPPTALRLAQGSLAPTGAITDPFEVTDSVIEASPAS